MSQLNALETQLPAVPMLEYLGKYEYSSDDLKRLGKITEINLCIHKHRMTNNALFILTVLIAAILCCVQNRNRAGWQPKSGLGIRYVNK